jgi:hypothetical protein
MPPDLQFTATLGECVGCGRRGLLNERQHCCDCLDAAMNKADALDSLEMAVEKCIDARLTEIQIRDATLKVITDSGGPLVCDALLVREFNGSDYVWQIRSPSWLLAARDGD